MILKNLLSSSIKRRLEKIVDLEDLLNAKKVLSIFVNSDENRNLKIVKTENFQNQLYEDKLFLFFNRLKADSIITTVL